MVSTTDDEAERVGRRTRDLYALVLRLHRGADERLVHAIAETNTSLSKLKLLHILARPHDRPPRISRVGAMLGLRSPQATRLVAELDRGRLIDRIPDENDGRIKRVVITPAGRELVETRLGQQPRMPALETFYRSLTNEQQRLLDRALDAIIPHD